MKSLHSNTETSLENIQVDLITLHFLSVLLPSPAWPLLYWDISLWRRLLCMFDLCSDHLLDSLKGPGSPSSTHSGKWIFYEIVAANKVCFPTLSFGLNILSSFTLPVSPFHLRHTGILHRSISFQPKVLEEIVQSKKCMKRRIILSVDHIYGLCLMGNKETEFISKKKFFLM